MIKIGWEPLEQQSYKDLPKEDRFSWADLNFSTLWKIIDARANNYEKYKSLITALECALNYYAEQDLEYESQMNVLNAEHEINKHNIGDSADLVYYDKKFKILSSLVGRVNLGTTRIKENIKSSKLMNEIAGKLAAGLGQNIFITGKPGSGKSESAVKLAQTICELNSVDFKIKRNICFTPSRFAAIYNDIENTPECSAIIFDETGVTLNNRDSLTAENKMFSKLMQIIRHRALLIFFTAPDLSFIDKSARTMLHYWFETVKLNKSNKICYIKPHVVDIIQVTGKVIYPFPVFNEQQLTEIRVPSLDESSRKIYQKVAKDYKEDLAVRTEIQFHMKKPNDEETLQYIIYRMKGITQTYIRQELLPMSKEKAANREKEYKRVLTYQQEAENKSKID